MTREKLINALKEIAGELGFEFYTGFDYRIAHEIRKFPAAWLYPPTLVKTEGRHEGLRYYDVKIALMALPSAADELGRLERAATRMCLMLSASEYVHAITDAAYTPAEFSLTAAGEVSITLAMKVRMPFYDAEETAL